MVLPRGCLALSVLVSACGTSPRTRDVVVPANAQGTAYLFAYFTDNGQDGLHLAHSRDGYTWTALKGGESFLRPEIGDGDQPLMRDPCVIQGPDGLFHMVWTTSWQGRTVGHASSRDLITWSKQQAIPVMSEHPGALNAWAPEIAWDAGRGHYLIHWASTVPGAFPGTAHTGDEGYNHRIYATTTKDFVSFSPTTLFYDPGFNVIDATILARGARFYLIIKDETLDPVRKHLRIAGSTDIAGPYTALSPPLTRSWVEGPSALAVGDAFLIFFDAYREGHYEAMRSHDLVTWQDVTRAISFPRGVRHGTALAVAHEILDGLLRPH